MLEIFIPDQYVGAVEDIDLDALAAAGIKGLLIDRDKTLTDWRSRDISEAKHAWIRAAKKRFEVCIVSNTIFGKGVRSVSTDLQIPYVARWGWGRKPFPGAIRAALEKIRCEAAETAMIGDQLFTDVWGGNAQGLRTILVEPAPGPEFIGTMIVRFFERIVIRLLKLSPENSVEGDD